MGGIFHCAMSRDTVERATTAICQLPWLHEQKNQIIDGPRFIVASSGGAGGGNGGYGDKAEGSGWDLGLPGPNRGTYDQKIARMASECLGLELLLYA